MNSPDATELAQLIRSGEVSPGEAVENAIGRIEAANPDINAVIHPRFEAARAEAAADLPDGPLRGVPFVVKDLRCAMAGEPHHQGSVGLKREGYIAPTDSYLYRRFRRLGLVCLGRTNTPEFAESITTEPVAYGPTRNPWNLDYSPGGSSGGSAAAVAAGMVPIAYGNDGGGSLRIPASACGLVGLKPTRGRISQGPDVGEGWAGAVSDGVLTRSVRDTAVVLDGISGPEPGDPYYAEPPARPFAAEVGIEPGTLHIGLAPVLPGHTTHTDCVDAVETTGRLLESLGHTVEPAHPEAMIDPGFRLHRSTILAANAAADFEKFSRQIGRPLTRDDVEPGTWRGYELGLEVSATAYLDALDWTHAWQRRMAEWWATDGFDILVTPTLGSPPPELGWLSDPERGPSRLGDISIFTAQFNVTGQPAISLPLHQSSDKLPVGVQFVGPYAGEGLLIRLACQVEAAAPWAHLTPPAWVG